MPETILKFLGLGTLSLLAVVACNNGTPVDNATRTDTSIRDVQGTGTTSPLDGQTLSLSGVVTGDFQDIDDNDSSNLGGFYIQTIDSNGDDRASDGLFIFDGADAAIDVNVGDVVSVLGTVQEYFGETQLAASNVTVSGTAILRVTELTLPFARVVENPGGVLIADLERYEGMLLRIPQQLSVTDLFNLERYGAVRLAEGGRLVQFTNANRPDIAGYNAYREQIASRSLVLDDGRRQSNLSPVRFLSNASGDALRVGDSISGVTGNLRFSRGSGSDGTETWRLMPTQEPDFSADNPRPGAPNVAGDLRIASFNVLNFFSTIDNSDDRCGPAGNGGCRGADSDDEQARQLAKTVTALALMDADIVGLVELENNESASLQKIVSSLNDKLRRETYAFVDTGSIGVSVIKTGFIYKIDSVLPRGHFALLSARVDERFADGRNRPALAQTFSHRSSGGSLTVVVNHLKSKGSSCSRDGDPNTRDGQGNCSKTRSEAAAAIIDWLASDPTGSNDDDFLVIGDLNAYVKEDPLQLFTDAGYENVITRDSVDVWSFVFDGGSGALDHALASPTLAAQVSDAIEWHINADESPVHDYNLEHGRDPSIFDGDTPYRASDHDPIIIGIDIRQD